MDVVSACPLRVGSIVWRHGPDAWALTVVCKATYLLLPTTSPLSPEQDEIHEGDARWDDDERRSLHAASDLAPFKRHAEVLLVGQAFAPRGQPVRSLLARLVAGSVDKTIAVHADRVWGLDGALREGAPFVKMPLRWERAAGGAGTVNPVGVRTGAVLEGAPRPLPNLEPPGTRVTSVWDGIEPIGFGPIAPTWPGRAERLLGMAAAWAGGAWTEEPPPGDLDPRFFNAAPPDQELDELREGDRIVLENLHPEHARLVTVLAPVRPQAAVERGDGGREVLALRADTLSFDSARGVCTLVWRGQLALSSRAEAGRVVISMETGAPASAMQGTVVAKWSGGPALPFKPAPALFTMGPQAAPYPGPAEPAPVGVPAEAMSTLRVVRRNPKPVLPFAEAAPAPPLPASPHQPIIVRPSSRSDDGTGTIAILGAPRRQPLPFAPGPRPAPDDPPAPAEPPVDPPPTASPALPAVPALIASPALPAVPAPSASPALPAVPASPVPSASPALSASPAPHAPPAPPTPPPPPPPMIGPLAGLAPETSADESPPAVMDQAVAEPPIADAEADASTEVDDVALRDVELTLEEYSAIEAEIAEGRATRSEVLKGQKLTEATFTRNEGRWTKALDEETSNGMSRLRTVADRAYVEAVETFRGPITIAEYARIAIALERGRAYAVLDELRIQRPALMRIVRLWTRKVARDPRLGKEARTLLAALRAGA